ncbi:hypothetical protein BWI17_21140 [Betaproteobacteria bacterium GR16-43]|nr:hypothetical protein BWI17_21140 [Betaproteobacteria bacterium GR16-43]
METQNPTTLNPASTLAIGQNRVLRNTYWLLALSLIPTILGAALGLTLNLGTLSPGIFLIVFFVGAYGLMFAVEKTKESSMGVVLLLAFTFFMGLMLSRLLGFILPMKNGAQLIMLAMGGTSAVFVAMAAWASTIKRDLSGMGKVLMIGLILAIVAGVANVFLQIPALMVALSVIVIGISSALLLYNLNLVMRGGETNYVSATLSIYVLIYNIFSNLLALLGIFGGDRD